MWIQTYNVIQRPSIIVKTERRKKKKLPVCFWATPSTPTPRLPCPIREEATLLPKASASGQRWTPRGPEDTEEHQPHYQQDREDTEEHQSVSQSVGCCCGCCCCCFIFPLAETLSLFALDSTELPSGKKTKKKQNSVLVC